MEIKVFRARAVLQDRVHGGHRAPDVDQVESHGDVHERGVARSRAPLCPLRGVGALVPIPVLRRFGKSRQKNIIAPERECADRPAGPKRTSDETEEEHEAGDARRRRHGGRRWRYPRRPSRSAAAPEFQAGWWFLILSRPLPRRAASERERAWGREA